MLSCSSCLTSKSIESPSLSLEGIDNVQGSDGLAASMLSVGDSITDDVLQEDLEDSTGLLIDQTTNALDTATACQTANSGLGDALDVVAKHLAMALGSSLSESLASLATSRHFELS